MGEAARRRGLGLPPRSVHCPVLTCRHRHVIHHPPTSELSLRLAKAWGGVTPADHHQCCKCFAVWESLPAGWSDDAVERGTRMGPCDTCAFRATSPETRDPEKRAKLHELASGNDPYAILTKPFCCHKGVPIKLTVDPPSVEFDYAAAGLSPADRLCSGFMRMVWARNGASKDRRERAAAGLVAEAEQVPAQTPTCHPRNPAWRLMACGDCCGLGVVPGCSKAACSGDGCDPEDAETCCAPQRCRGCDGTGLVEHPSLLPPAQEQSPC